jgi:hypothetical protein
VTGGAVFANIAICAWPLVAIAFYRIFPLGLATMWTILGAQMLLPVGAAIKFEMIPQFDKTTVPNLCALIGCFLVAKRPVKFVQSIGLAELFVLMSLIGPFVTSELNGDDIVVGDRVLPGVGIYDAISAMEAAFISLIPFFLGRQYLKGSHDNLAILNVLVTGGLIYSVPMLFEMRFSPQLHFWFYGYYASEFIQSMRDGGFRPMVFMGHGLVTSFFIMTSTVAAGALWQLRFRRASVSYGPITSYLGAVLILCRSLGSTVYAFVLVLLVKFAKPRFQLRIASALVSIALFYPMLRSFDLVPTNQILNLASAVSTQRADSMKFRFVNEDALLKKASQRLLFGWGRYGRSRVYGGWGQDISVTDGRWVITLGTFGLLGFIAEFGLLSLCVFRAAMALKFAESKADQICLAALALIVSVNIFDLLPNSGWFPWSWLLAGALLGRAEAMSALKNRQRARAKQPLPRGEPKIAGTV